MGCHAGDLDQFRHGIDPIAEAGRLAAILLQFPPSFHAAPETRAYLEWLLRALAGYPLAVELRHRSWSDDAADTRARLTAHDAAWALIDEPKFKDSVVQETTSGVVSEEGRETTPEVCSTSACTDATRRTGGRTERPRIATTISIRRTSWSRSRKSRERARGTDARCCST